MYATLIETELELECRFRVHSRDVHPRELSGKEKQNQRARFRRQGPKLRTPGGTHQRRNKKYAF